MRLHNEKVIQEDPGNKRTAPEAEASLVRSRKVQEITGVMLERKGCYRPRALMAIVKSLVFILKKQGSYFPIRLFSIKKISGILFLHTQIF